jgi:hypothetical protein
MRSAPPLLILDSHKLVGTGRYLELLPRLLLALLLLLQLLVLVGMDPPTQVLNGVTRPRNGVRLMLLQSLTHGKSIKKL